MGLWPWRDGDFIEAASMFVGQKHPCVLLPQQTLDGAHLCTCIRLCLQVPLSLSTCKCTHTHIYIYIVSILGLGSYLSIYLSIYLSVWNLDPSCSILVIERAPTSADRCGATAKSGKLFHVWTPKKGHRWFRWLLPSGNLLHSHGKWMKMAHL